MTEFTVCYDPDSGVTVLVLMQNQTQIRICESENLSLAHAVHSAQITVQATQGEISDNSLISLKTVASDTLKHLGALGLAQATPMRPGAPTFRTPSLAAAVATCAQIIQSFFQQICARKLPHVKRKPPQTAPSCPPRGANR